MHLAAAELMPNAGFSDVQYTKTASSTEAMDALAAGESDIILTFSGSLIMRVDQGDPIVILGGSHPGCAELFGTNHVGAIRDLKGTTVAVPELGAGSMQHLIVASMASYVGMDPSRDINFVVRPQAEAMQLLAEGSIDAYLGYPPTAQQLRAQHVGRLIVNTMADKPWSQYFCCMIAGNREFVRSNPVATKRAVRALLNANQVCDREPERVARFLVDGGYTDQYDYALDAIKDGSYGEWRNFDAEDTLRFWSLRLYEAGMIKSTPDQILQRGTNWRFVNELKEELKA